MFRGTEGLSAGEVQAIVKSLGRRFQRVHDRRLHELPHDVPEGRPRDDAEDRGRPVPEPQVRRAVVQERSPRGPRRIQQERVEPVLEAQRGHAGHGLHVHTYKHTTIGFLADIKDMPNQYAYCKMFFDRWYRPENCTIIVAGDVDPATDDRPRREVLERLEAGRQDAADPAGAAREGPRRRARAVAVRDAALGRRRVPRPGLLGDEEGSSRPRRPLRPHVRPHVRPLQEARREGAESRLVPAERRHQRGSRAGRRPRPPQERDGPRLRARRDPRGDGGAARHARRREAPRRGEVELPLRPRARPRRHGAHRGPPRPLRAAAPLVRDDQPVLPPHRVPHADRPPGRGADVPHGREPRPNDALEGRDAGGHGRRPDAGQLRGGGEARRRARGRVDRAEVAAPAPRGQVPLRRRIRVRPGRQGRPRRSHRAPDRGRRLPGPENRRDQKGPLPRRRELRRRRGPRDDHLHGRRPQGRLDDVRGRRAPAARRARLPRGGLPARQGRPEERARPEPAQQQRRGARQGTPPAADLRRARRTATRRSARSPVSTRSLSTT